MNQVIKVKIEQANGTTLVVDPIAISSIKIMFKDGSQETYVSEEAETIENTIVGENTAVADSAE